MKRKVKAWISVHKTTGRIWNLYFYYEMHNSIDSDWYFIPCTITYDLPKKPKRGKHGKV